MGFPGVDARRLAQAEWRSLDRLNLLPIAHAFPGRASRPLRPPRWGHFFGTWRPPIKTAPGNAPLKVRFAGWQVLGGCFRLPVNKTVRPVRRNANLAGWGSHSGGPAMTEYKVKDIGHQWIVYAGRQSIGACADEDSALKLIAEHSAANCATRRSTVQGTSPSYS